MHLSPLSGLDEAGIDGGGIFREFLNELLKEAFNPTRGYFVMTHDKLLYPNPLAHLVDPHFHKHYFFLGRMLGPWGSISSFLDEWVFQ